MAILQSVYFVNWRKLSVSGRKKIDALRGSCMLYMGMGWRVGTYGRSEEHSSIFYFRSCFSILQNGHLMLLLHGGGWDWMSGRDLYQIWRSILVFSVSVFAFEHGKIFFQCSSSAEHMIKLCWRSSICQFSLFYWAPCGTKNLVLLPLFFYKNMNSLNFTVDGLFKCNCLVCPKHGHFTWHSLFP